MGICNLEVEARQVLVGLFGAGVWKGSLGGDWVGSETAAVILIFFGCRSRWLCCRSLCFCWRMAILGYCFGKGLVVFPMMLWRGKAYFFFVLNFDFILFMAIEGADTMFMLFILKFMFCICFWYFCKVWSFLFGLFIFSILSFLFHIFHLYINFLEYNW